MTVGDIHAEFDRLTGRGVKFLGPPERTGPVTSAFFDDTCGNFIVMAEPSA
ncbi:hypothetical protein EN794_046700 [Mesorhizobium sp. M00.F.Ca.ET.151.01.1.1]|nr:MULTISPECIES: VOC family protein [unclassified Mesorhizobium]RUX01350.1 hypothetical protein EOA35_17000 [Mesorhizobium sp. M8A.F.Ca.ET.023.01.1.1]TGT47613.1 hypothetical protein EN810_32560 [Mesorhizobium sp. M8A.F.Ca.ET.167.01.1.1]TGU89446.1 hypothetical protein EN794_046700 [Mesorhizobium sp. M00.F.Ca.ET.151.01.1.1]RWC71367.1 MAG: hypothetical protein EOS71_23680 [Mesorhizobium sp.]RWF40467.1 MAG: hypothetical protein EOS46_29490 [Mesorhizobium sp.]